MTDNQPATGSSGRYRRYGIGSVRVQADDDHARPWVWCTDCPGVELVVDTPEARAEHDARHRGEL